MVAQDAFSKWPEAKAIPSCPKTADIINWLKLDIFARFGIPKQIMTDQGSQLESKDFLTFLSSNSIGHRVGAAYHHQTNGLVERFNRTLQQLLRSNSPETANWDQAIQGCLHAYGTTEHRVTKRSPFEIIFGLRPRLKIDTALELEISPQSQSHS